MSMIERHKNWETKPKGPTVNTLHSSNDIFGRLLEKLITRLDIIPFLSHNIEAAVNSEKSKTFMKDHLELFSSSPVV